MAISASIKYMLISFYIITFLAGVILNIALLYRLLSRERTRRRTSNLYLISVLIATLLSCLTGCPYYLISVLAKLPKVSNESLENYCRAAIYFNYSIAVCKILSLTLLSLDRCIAIVWPYVYKKNVARLRIIYSLLFVWIQAITTTLPLPLMTGWVNYNGNTGSPCGFNWSMSRYEFIIPVGIIDFLIPAILLVTANIKVFIVARMQRRSIRQTIKLTNVDHKMRGKLHLVGTLARAITLMESTVANSYAIREGDGCGYEVNKQKEETMRTDCNEANNQSEIDSEGQFLSNTSKSSSNRENHRIHKPVTVTDSRFTEEAKNKLYLTNIAKESTSEETRTEKNAECKKYIDTGIASICDPTILLELSNATEEEKQCMETKLDIDEAFDKFGVERNLDGANIEHVQIHMANKDSEEAVSSNDQTGRGYEAAFSKDKAVYLEPSFIITNNTIENQHITEHNVEQKANGLTAQYGSSPSAEENVNVAYNSDGDVRLAENRTKNEGYQTPGELWEIASTPSFDNDDLSRLPNSKRLKILSNPISHNQQIKHTRIKSSHPSLVISTVLLVVLFLLTWLPFVVSRIASTVGQFQLSIELVAISAAITNIDIVANPLIILGTRKGLRQALLTSFRRLFTMDTNKHMQA